MSDEGVKYARITDIPPETVIRLTEIAPHGTSWDYSDYGEHAYCSECGTKSERRARTDLWAIRHQTDPDLPGPVNRYCLEHLPSREWEAGGSTNLAVRRDEYPCPDCDGLIVRVGTPCPATGKEHRRP